MNHWKNLSNILVIRLDNMGDLLMSVPAINALKETFRCKISLLTSSAAKPITAFIPSLDEVIVYDAPWMKHRDEPDFREATTIIDFLRNKKFDAAVLFTVFSQNPLPTMMLAYLANIPLRLMYCRENPYALATDWVPDPEPYDFIRHQVHRDLDLVAHINAKTSDDNISLVVPQRSWDRAREKMQEAGIDITRPWVVFHPGVSEEKRQYPLGRWVDTAKRLRDIAKVQIVLTGIEKEKDLTDTICALAGEGVFSMAGALTIDEFIATIDQVELVVSVNTATVHLAAATHTKVVVLYAMTNPQHTPWKAVGLILPFEVPEHLRSRNEVLRYVDKTFFPGSSEPLMPERVANAAVEVLSADFNKLIPELFDFKAHRTTQRLLIPR